MTVPTNASPPKELPTLRQKTTRGILWLAAQAMATRGATALQQLALGWLLLPADFGPIALTYTVTMFVNLVANPGIDTILVKRQRRFKQWATPAFWMGLTAGLAASALMLLLAPVAAKIYEQPELTGLISVLALAPAFQSLQIVPRAQLQLQMRFRAVALLGVLNNLLLASLTVSAAFVGMKSYSFVVPVPIVSAIVAATHWYLVRPHVRRRLELDRWKYLIGSSLTLLATQALFVFDNQADNISLGLARLPESAIGIYWFAFSVAVQSLRLISGSVMTVLFPGLSHLSLEPEKQTRAALRAMRLLVLVCVPFCLLQTVITAPAFRLLLPAKWTDAILPCQILTIGLMVNAACWPAASLMNAQGRFRLQLWFTFATSLLLAAMLAGALWYRRSVLSVAWTMTLWHCLYSPLFHTTAFGQRAPRWSYFRELAPPLVAGLVASVPSMLLQWYLPETWSGDLVSLAAGSLVFVIAYLLLIRAIVPASLDDLMQQVLPLWHRFRGAPPPSGNAESHVPEVVSAGTAADRSKSS
ncbi:MAG: oligosaccharide flippase family protein [Pirellulales bacterium]